MYQCHTPTCPLYHVRYHPEEEGRWALPHGEFGDVSHRPDWHLAVEASIAVSRRCISACRPVIFRSKTREVTHLMQRYEELVTLRIMDHERIKARLQKQGQVILALDGLQPDVGHEVRMSWSVIASQKKSC